MIRQKQSDVKETNMQFIFTQTVSATKNWPTFVNGKCEDTHTHMSKKYGKTFSKVKKEIYEQKIHTCTHRKKSGR